MLEARGSEMEKVDDMNSNSQASRPQDKPADNTIRRRTARRALSGAAAIAGAMIAVAGLAACGSAAHAPASGTIPSRTPASAAAQYSSYQSVMRGYFGGMMGGGQRWVMGEAIYRWRTGVNGMPGWMWSPSLPGFMTGTGIDPGTMMGRLWADGPGPQISPARAVRLGDQIPAGAEVNRATRIITFATTSVRLDVVASPRGGPDEAFQIAGLINPRLVMLAGARVSIEVINADSGTAHGLVITAAKGARSSMPMMTARPAFPGSALWFLGDATTAGMHAGIFVFTASTPGTYRYLCPVPGHAFKGMTGLLTITA
jgi:uncharacterized cupredoxin-like copper-binding protein